MRSFLGVSLIHHSVVASFPSPKNPRPKEEVKESFDPSPGHLFQNKRQVRRPCADRIVSHICRRKEANETTKYMIAPDR